MLGQLPGAAPPHAPAVRGAGHRQGQQAEHREQQQAPRTAPPRRQHVQLQDVFARGIAGRIEGLHAQAVAAGRERGKHALAARALVDPSAIEPFQQRPVAVAQRILVAEQARADQQLVVARLQLQRLVHAHVHQAVAAAHLQAVHHQVGRHRLRVRQVGVEQRHRSVRRRRRQQAVGRHQQAAVVQFLAQQAFAHAEVAQQRAGSAQVRIDAEQSAPGTQPHPALRIHGQPGRLDRGQSFVGADPAFAHPAGRIAAPRLDTGHAVQPETVGVFEGEGVHPLAAHGGHRNEARGGRVPDAHAFGAAQPEAAVGRGRDALDVGQPRRLIVLGDRAQHAPAAGVALLHAAHLRDQPQGVVRRFHQPVDRGAVGHGVLALLRPLHHRTGAGIGADQAVAVADPQLPVAVLQDRGEPQFAQQGRMVRQRGDVAAAGVQPFHLAGAAGDPDAVGPGLRDAAIESATQTLRRRERGDAPPIRTQVGQPTGRHRHPQSSVRQRQHGLQDAADAHVLRIVVDRGGRQVAIGAPQPALTGEPVFALAVAGHRDQRIGPGEHRRPRRRHPPLLRRPAVHAVGRADPYRIPVRGHRIDDRVLAVRQREPAHVTPVVAGKPVHGADPQHATGIEGQRQHVVRRQAVPYVGRCAEPRDAAIRGQPVQSTAERAEPHVAAAAGNGEHVVAAHLRMVRLAEMAESAPVRLHHAEAAILGAHPYAVGGVDVQCLHHVAGQRSRIGRIVPPHLETHAVVACQAIPGGHPQVAGTVARERRDGGRRQAVAGAQQAEAGDLGHRRLHGRADQPHQQQPPRTPRHSCPPLVPW